MPQSIDPNQQTATTTGSLAPSSNRGRYQIGREAEGQDITSGQHCAVFLGGQWIEGRIEYGLCYVNGHTDKMLRPGYFFLDKEGNSCGVCMGMLVRIYSQEGTMQPKTLVQQLTEELQAQTERSQQLEKRVKALSQIADALFEIAEPGPVKASLWRKYQNLMLEGSTSEQPS